MRYVKIVVCGLSLVMPVAVYLLLDPAVWLSAYNLCFGVIGALFFLDLPVAVCLLHWLRPQYFRLKKSGWYSPFPWLLLMLVFWIYVAGGEYLAIRLGRGPENGFSVFCAYCFGWTYIWFTMIPIGLVYLLIRAAARLAFKQRPVKNLPMSGTEPLNKT
ncbi:MAG: hypothetical protein IJS01_14120 [Lentisphaeria bacterium]|nr:hypothetical protein [Lentisphaeria bacterium]